MTLRRQLLLVSLLALLLPWAGCQFVRETESALRASQQQMLAGTARAIADSLSQYPDAFPAAEAASSLPGQLYAHALETSPVVDGYFEDWPIGESSLVPLPADAPLARYVLGSHAGQLYLFVAVSDPTEVYATSASLAPSAHAPWADRVVLVSVTPPYDEVRIAFAAEAPGTVVPFAENAFGFALEPTIRAVWQDVPGGYQLEARLPRAQIGSRAGLIVEDVSDAARPGTAFGQLGRFAAAGVRRPGRCPRRRGARTRPARPAADRDRRRRLAHRLGRQPEVGGGRGTRRACRAGCAVLTTPSSRTGHRPPTPNPIRAAANGRTTSAPRWLARPVQTGFAAARAMRPSSPWPSRSRAVGERSAP